MSQEPAQFELLYIVSESIFFSFSFFPFPNSITQCTIKTLIEFHLIICVLLKKFVNNENSGYMSPEYAMDGLFSEKSDVFSFGVMVLEILSGKKNNADFDQTNECTKLLEYVSDHEQ